MASRIRRGRDAPSEEAHAPEPHDPRPAGQRRRPRRSHRSRALRAQPRVAPAPRRGRRGGGRPGDDARGGEGPTRSRPFAPPVARDGGAQRDPQALPRRRPPAQARGGRREARGPAGHGRHGGARRDAQDRGRRGPLARRAQPLHRPAALLRGPAAARDRGAPGRRRGDRARSPQARRRPAAPAAGRRAPRRPLGLGPSPRGPVRHGGARLDPRRVRRRDRRVRGGLGRRGGHGPGTGHDRRRPEGRGGRLADRRRGEQRADLVGTRTGARRREGRRGDARRRGVDPGRDARPRDARPAARNPP